MEAIIEKLAVLSEKYGLYNQKTNLPINVVDAINGHIMVKSKHHLIFVEVINSITLLTIYEKINYKDIYLTHLYKLIYIFNTKTINKSNISRYRFIYMEGNVDCIDEYGVDLCIRLDTFVEKINIINYKIRDFNDYKENIKFDYITGDGNLNNTIVLTCELYNALSYNNDIKIALKS